MVPYMLGALLNSAVSAWHFRQYATSDDWIDLTVAIFAAGIVVFCNAAAAEGKR